MEAWYSGSGIESCGPCLSDSGEDEIGCAADLHMWHIVRKMLTLGVSSGCNACMSVH